MDSRRALGPGKKISNFISHYYDDYYYESRQSGLTHIVSYLVSSPKHVRYHRACKLDIEGPAFWHGSPKVTQGTRLEFVSSTSESSALRQGHLKLTSRFASGWKCMGSRCALWQRNEKPDSTRVGTQLTQGNRRQRRVVRGKASLTRVPSFLPHPAPHQASIHAQRHLPNASTSFTSDFDPML